MGSVPDLYTTGDNDPQIEPEQYYRHYLYCDACGSFELDPWQRPEDTQGIEKTRRRLASAAVVSLVVAAVAGWTALVSFPSPAILLLLAAGMAIPPVVWRLGLKADTGSGLTPWRFVRGVLLWLPLVAASGWLADEVLSPWGMVTAALLVFVGLMLTRSVSASKIQYRGNRCRACGATYAFGTAFFTDLAANPRQLTVADVPRPLGRSPFEIGKSVAGKPSPPPGRLPP